MDIYSLTIFLRLCETLHFGKASRLSNISPSALSRMIQRIEEEVGEQLFLRDRRSVELTPAGEILRRYAQEVVTGFREVQEQLRGEEVRGELSLFASVTAAYAILPELLDTFRKAYPQVHLKLQTGAADEAISRVLDGGIDISIAAKPRKLPDGLAFREIRSTPLVMIVPKMKTPFTPLLKDAKPAVWERIPMILPERGIERELVDQWFSRQNLHPNVYAKVAGNEGIIAMVSLGCGVGVVPKLVVEKSYRDAAVEPVDVKPALEDISIGLCARKRNSHFQLIKAFWDL